MPFFERLVQRNTEWKSTDFNVELNYADEFFIGLLLQLSYYGSHKMVEDFAGSN